MKRAIGNYVLIKKVQGEERKRRSGLTDTASTTEDRWIKAEIVSVGHVGQNEFGLKEGQVVLYDKHAGQPLTVEGDKFHMITSTDVSLIL